MQLEHRNAAQASPLSKISLSFLSQSAPSTPAQKDWLEAQVNVDELDEQIETDHGGFDYWFCHHNCVFANQGRQEEFLV